MQMTVTQLVGTQIRRARTGRNLSLNEVATRARISVATLSRIERDKQGLDLGLFLILCRILRAAPQDLIEQDSPEVEADPLARKIAALDHIDRVQLWRDLAEARRNDRRGTVPARVRRLGEKVEELLAQLEFVRAEIESVHKHVMKR